VFLFYSVINVQVEINVGKKEDAGKYCGNCDSHNCYDYPSKVFCSTLHAQNSDPIVDTLWHCSSWSRVSQECYCVREALKQKKLSQR
jgi:hypothetical protein